jgi:Flp pilus assembly protein TadB
VDTNIPPRQLQPATDGTTRDVPRRVEALSAATLDEDGFTTAVELALTPAVFGVVGFLLDSWLGIVPVLTIVLSMWAFVVVAWMTWRRYDAKMERLEAALPARRPRS